MAAREITYGDDLSHIGDTSIKLQVKSRDCFNERVEKGSCASEDYDQLLTGSAFDALDIRLRGSQITLQGESRECGGEVRLRC